MKFHVHIEHTGAINTCTIVDSNSGTLSEKVLTVMSQLPSLVVSEIGYYGPDVVEVEVRFGME